MRGLLHPESCSRHLLFPALSLGLGVLSQNTWCLFFWVFKQLRKWWPSVDIHILLGADKAGAFSASRKEGAMEEVLPTSALIVERHRTVLLLAPTPSVEDLGN